MPAESPRETEVLHLPTGEWPKPSTHALIASFLLDLQAAMTESNYTTLETHTDTFPSRDVLAVEAQEQPRSKKRASKKGEVCNQSLSPAEGQQDLMAQVHMTKGNLFQYGKC